MAMAKVDCKCPRCGAEYRYRVKCFNRREADALEARTDPDRLCPSCYRETLHEEENKRAAEAAAANGYAELSGSEKQIAWAMAIREKMIADFDRQWKCDTDKGRHGREVFLACTNAQTEAKWWIDNRDSLYLGKGNPILEAAVAQLQKEGAE